MMKGFQTSATEMRQTLSEKFPGEQHERITGGLAI
jgi:hypothetical protein